MKLLFNIPLVVFSLIFHCCPCSSKNLSNSDTNVLENATVSPLLQEQQNANKSENISDNESLQTNHTFFETILILERLIAEEKMKLLTTSEYDHFGIYSKRGLDNNTRIEESCTDDIRTVLMAGRNKHQWALDLIDASGKPRSGILRGNRIFIGDYDECMDVRTGHNFEGRFCTTTILILISQKNQMTSSPPIFTIGLCIPSSCNASDVEMFLSSYLPSLPDISASAVQTNCQELDLPFTTKAKIMVGIVSLVVLLMLTSTAYDVFHQLRHDNNMDLSKPTNDNQQEGNLSTPGICCQLLLSFSLYRNASKLLSAHRTQDAIGCIHGIRFMTMPWIILYHLHGFAWPLMDNWQPYTAEAYKRWSFIVVPNAVIAVDTFFAMSGLLVAYHVLKELSVKSLTPKFIGIFYLHRFWRLTPCYMLILMTYYHLFKYVSDGPFWLQDGLEGNKCDDYWWSNLFYFNNFMEEKKQCMQWTWYLANDMQFFVISPILFLPMFFYEWKGLLVSVAFLIGNAICSGVISQANDLHPVQRIEDWGLAAPTNYFNVYYIKPYIRIGPYIIGMMTGFLLFKSNSKAQLPRFVVTLGWIIAAATALAVVYGPYKSVSSYSLSTEISALYNALHHIAWGMSVCWVIFACANGYGGFVNSLLSWRPFIPLSMLTYCAYLIHPMVVMFFMYSQRKPFYLNNINMATVFVAVVTMTYSVAFVVSLAYEIPMTGLEKVIRGHIKKRTKSMHVS